jgi:hypothetical protein
VSEWHAKSTRAMDGVLCVFCDSALCLRIGTPNFAAADFLELRSVCESGLRIAWEEDRGAGGLARVKGPESHDHRPEAPLPANRI